MAESAELYQFYRTSIPAQRRAACAQLLSSGAVAETDLPAGAGTFGEFLRREETVQEIQDEPARDFDEPAGASVRETAG